MKFGTTRWRSSSWLLPALAAIVVSGAAYAQPGQASDDTGFINASATVSPMAEITAAAPFALTNNLGGSISGNVIAGALITGVTIDFGEVGPINAQSNGASVSVRARVPIRVRSNVSYSVTMRVASFTFVSPAGFISSVPIIPADVGFGAINKLRSGVGIYSPGADSVTVPTVDPSTVATLNLTSGRINYPSARTLQDFMTDTQIMNGDRVMRAVPRTAVGGVTVDTVFALGSLFYDPGSFSATIVYTVSTP